MITENILNLFLKYYFSRKTYILDKIQEYLLIVYHDEKKLLVETLNDLVISDNKYYKKYEILEKKRFENEIKMDFA